MSLLATLAHYMAGEFDNQEQAIENPTWFVHLRLWQRPVSLFRQDSITLFAEQANVLKLEQAYRQRLMRLQLVEQNPGFPLKIQYYMFKDPDTVKGAGQNPALLETLTEEHIDCLPGCVLQVALQTTEQGISFIASAPVDARCSFSFQGNTIQVSLGFEANPEKFLSYDKGIDPATETPIWGAILGAYEFTKRQQYSIPNP